MFRHIVWKEFAALVGARLLQNTFPEKKIIKKTHTLTTSRVFYHCLYLKDKILHSGKKVPVNDIAVSWRTLLSYLWTVNWLFCVVFLEKKLWRLDSHIQINFERFQEHCFLLALYANSVNKHLFAILSMHTRSGRLGSITLSVDIKKISQDFASFILQHWIKNMFMPFAITFSGGTFCIVANG